MPQQGGVVLIALPIDDYSLCPSPSVCLSLVLVIDLPRMMRRCGC